MRTISADAGTVTQNFAAPIPNIPGKSLIAVEVEFAPGQVGAPHRHANSAFIYAYVVSGAIESKVDDEKVRTPALPSQTTTFIRCGFHAEVGIDSWGLPEEREDFAKHRERSLNGRLSSGIYPIPPLYP